MGQKIRGQERERERLIAEIAEYFRNVEGSAGCSSRKCGGKIYGDGEDSSRRVLLPKGTNLAQVFASGCSTLGIKVVETDAASGGSTGDERDDVESSEKFKKFLRGITERGYFKDAVEGSPEYATRYERALKKYKTKISKSGGSGSADSAGSQGQTESSSAENFEKAEEIKARGNDALRAKDFAKALELYREACAVCPKGKNTHIYHSNAAATLLYLERYEEAAVEGVKSIALNSSYAKAHARLGTARLEMRLYDKAVESFEKALELDPKNATAQRSLQRAKSMAGSAGAAAPVASQQSSTQPSGAPGAPGMPGMPWDAWSRRPWRPWRPRRRRGGGIMEMMNNPQFMQQAQQMMSNPMFQQMAQQMMSDPNAMANAMSALGGAGGAGAGAGGGMPDMSPEAIQQAMSALGGGAGGAVPPGSKSE